MQTTLEHELKFDVEADFALPGLEGERLEPRVFTSIYHDTRNRSLARCGITLRCRIENEVARWQLKLPRTPGTRAELEEPGPAAAPPEALTRLLAAHLRRGPLETVATLRTRRTGIRIVDGTRSLADVTVDEVEVENGGSSGGFRELEAELIDGDTSDLERLGRILRRAGAHRSAGEPKLLRVLGLAPPEPPAHSAPLRDQLRHLLDAQWRALETHDPGVRLGDDPEDLHRFRVATRRTRALIRATRPLLGGALPPPPPPLRWLTALLGPVRDLDVLLAHLRPEVACLDIDERAGRTLVGALEARRHECRGRLFDGLTSERYLALLDSFEKAVETLPALAADATADELARESFRRFRRAARALPADPPDELLHALRIRAKRARYASELAALGGKPVTARAVSAFRDVQDVIGVHQDAVVAEAYLRGAVEPSVAVAAGRLVERERTRRAAARAAYTDAVATALRAGRRAFG